VYSSHIQCVIKNSSFCITHKSSVVPLPHILCYKCRLVIRTVVSLTTVKFKPLIISMSVFSLSYTASMFILTILYDLCSLRAPFCCIIVYMRRDKNRMQIGYSVYRGKFAVVRSACYIASGRTNQKTQFQTVTLFLCTYLLPRKQAVTCCLPAIA
jgi:hypothetical protein